MSTRKHIEKSIHRVLVAAKVQIPTNEEEKWNANWDQGSASAGGKLSGAAVPDVPYDPLTARLNPEMRAKVHQSKSLRDQLERIRDFIGPNVNILESLNWTQQDAVKRVLEAMIERKMINFPVSLTPMQKIAALNTLARRLNSPLASSAIIAWMGIKIDFIDTAKIHCTRVCWTLPLAINDEEFQLFLDYWIQEYKLQNYIIKQDKTKDAERESAKSPNVNAAQSNAQASPSQSRSQPSDKPQSGSHHSLLDLQQKLDEINKGLASGKDIKRIKVKPAWMVQAEAMAAAARKAMSQRQNESAPKPEPASSAPNKKRNPVPIMQLKTKPPPPRPFAPLFNPPKRSFSMSSTSID